MNSHSAKQILIACRPGTGDLETADARAALEQVARDPELDKWWRQQQAFHRAMRDAFRHAPVPADLKDQIILRNRVVALPWWRKPIVLGAAAAIVMLAINLAIFWKPAAPTDGLATFRSRMVGNVLRQYSMDIETNDMAAIRQFLAGSGAPSTYQLPPGLAQHPALGAGVLSWQDRRVSMVCLDSRSQGTLFLFVVDDPALREPAGEREFAAVHDLMTVSWREGTNTYLLAGHGGKEWLGRQLAGE